MTNRKNQSVSNTFDYVIVTSHIGDSLSDSDQEEEVEVESGEILDDDSRDCPEYYNKEHR